MNRKKLKQLILMRTNRADTLTALAELLGKTPAAIGYKMRGGTQFTASELDMIRVTYGMTDSEFVEILIDGEREKLEK